jgi:hypothetical protein
LIGALIFTGLQVRAANRARRDQAAVTVIETAALSENSARFLELLSEIPDGASATAIENLDAETRRQIFLFGLRVEVIGYMVFHGLVDVQTVNDLAGGAILSFWSRAKNWSEERRKRTGHDEFLEWCEWLATQIAQYRATRPHVPAYSRVRATGGPDRQQKSERQNGANGMSDIEGKAATVAASECGQRVSFNFPDFKETQMPGLRIQSFKSCLILSS